eukprot:9475579-Pyramimonas_sp.AAC.1
MKLRVAQRPNGRRTGAMMATRGQRCRTYLSAARCWPSSLGSLPRQTASVSQTLPAASFDDGDAVAERGETGEEAAGGVELVALRCRSITSQEAIDPTADPMTLTKNAQGKLSEHAVEFVLVALAGGTRLANGRRAKEAR